MHSPQLVLPRVCQVQLEQAQGSTACCASQRFLFMTQLDHGQRVAEDVPCSATSCSSDITHT